MKWDPASVRYGTLLLTITGLVNQLLGFVYRILLSRLVGAEVMGLYQLVMPVFSVLGAHCTLLDYSPAQLAGDEMVARREGYEIELIRADMTRPLPFEDGSFDLIFHPVSTCYIREVLPVWRECFRVLWPGGILLA